MTDDERPTPRAEVLLGLGANVGDPRAQLARAVDAIRGFVDGVRVSSIYRTEPVGHRDQPDFYNQVLAGTTALSARELLVRLLALEREMGRERTFRNAPRVIDLDVLAYADAVIDEPDLAIPHPGIQSRGFVLHPLAEVAPAWRHPVLGSTAQELLAAAQPTERVDRLSA